MHPMLVKAGELLDKKSEDYNGTADADPARQEYFPYGHLSYLQMLHTKLKRLESVVTNPGDVNFESAKDSAIDLINYAAFYAAFLELQE